MLIKLALLSLCVCSLTAYEPIKVLRQESNIDEKTAQHSYVYETENGIYEDQQGYPKDPHHLAVQGQVQFALPNGKVYSLSYTADENGYQPKGDILPTPPPIPPAIQRALKYLESLPKEKKQDIRSEDYDDGKSGPGATDDFLLPPL